MSTSSQPTPESDQASKGLILIADDHEELLQAMHEFLEQQGYTVISAEDGKRALAALRACPHPPDLIIADGIMPQMSGWDLVLEVRKEPTWKCIPILFMTVLDGPDFFKLSEMAGGVWPFPKPFNADQLLRGIEDALARSRASS